MSEQTTTATSYVVEPWKCPKCGANNKFNPNICTSCNYSKIPPIQVLPPQSRMIWEKISYALVAVLLALQLGYAVSIFLGFGLTLLYNIGGEFLETALQVPDMLLYSHYVTAGVCLVLAAWNAWELIAAIKNKERLTGALQKAALINAIAVWTFPIVNILTDVVATSIKRNGVNLRSHTAYDVFDMGLNVLIPAIIAVVCFVIMYVNNRLAPEDNLDDDE